MRVRFTLILFALLALIGCKEQEDEKMKGALYGLITDRVTSAPISDANVTLLPIGQSVVTGQEGSYRFDGLVPRNYTLEVKKAGYPKPEKKSLNVQAGQQLEVHFQLDSRSGKLIAITSDGGSLSQLDFGGEKNDNSRSFTLLNDSDNSNVEWHIEHSLPWIESVTPSKGKFNANEQVSILVKIDRDRIDADMAQGLLHVLSKEGTLEINVTAAGRFKEPSVVLLGCEAISSEAAFATLIVQEWGAAQIKNFGVQVVYPNEAEWRSVLATLSSHAKTYFATIPTGSSAPLGSALRVRPCATDAKGNVVWNGGEVRVPIERHAPVVKLEAGGSGYPDAYSVVWRMEQLGYPVAERLVVNVSGTWEKAQAGVVDASWSPSIQLLDYGHQGDTLLLKPSGGEELKSDYTHYIFVAPQGAGVNPSVRSNVLAHRRANPNWHCIESLRIMVQRQDLGNGSWSVAKTMCEGSNLGGYTNWRLPTEEEAAAIYAEREAVGGFSGNGYWTSNAWRNKVNESYATFIDFKEGTFTTSPAGKSMQVRAVRTY